MLARVAVPQADIISVTHTPDANGPLQRIPMPHSMYANVSYQALRILS